MRTLLLFTLFTAACGPNVPPDLHDLDTDAPDSGVRDSGTVVLDSGTPDAGQPSCSQPVLRALEVDQRCAWAGAMANVDLAIERLVANGVASSVELSGILAKVSVRVLWDPDSKLGGVYYTTKQIEISSSMDGMAHEFIHAIEDARGTVDWSDPHRGWNQNQAYMTAMQSYVWNHRSVVCSR